MIAEDDPSVRSMVLDVIAELGHAPSCATDGAEALRLYEQRGADVVVSDWLMPRLDGIELCRRVRRRLGAPYTYFILLTALGDAEHRIAGMQAGADDYLAKPFTLADIEARLIAAERVTALHRRREALLRQVRRFAAESDPRQLLDELRREAIQLVGGSTGQVTRWDDHAQALIPLGTQPTACIALGQGASGQAAARRQPVLLQRGEDDADQLLSQSGVQSCLALPLLHDDRLLGTLAVATDDPTRLFTQADLDLLEMLVSTAAAALLAIEHARLEGVLLAARTAQHELNNQLALARGYAELLVGSPDLPPQLAEMAEEVKQATDAAARTVRQLRSVSRIREREWSDPSDSTIDLGASNIGRSSSTAAD